MLLKYFKSLECGPHALTHWGPSKTAKQKGLAIIYWGWVLQHFLLPAWRNSWPLFQSVEEVHGSYETASTEWGTVWSIHWEMLREAGHPGTFRNRIAYSGYKFILESRVNKTLNDHIPADTLFMGPWDQVKRYFYLWHECFMLNLILEVCFHS